MHAPANCGCGPLIICRKEEPARNIDIWSTASRQSIANGKQGRIAHYLTRLDLVVLDVLGDLPLA